MRSITYPSIIALAFCLLLTSAAFAQEAVSVAADAESSIQTNQATGSIEVQAEAEASRAQAREAAETSRADAVSQRQEAQTERTQARAERRAELDARSKQRITNLAANISNRMDAAAARMQNIITRLESRIDKLAETGPDTTEASAALASAQTSVDAAVRELAQIDVIVQAAVTAENPRTAWTNVRTAYTSIRAQLRTAHTELKASVQALKDAAQATDAQSGPRAAVQNNTATESDEADATITSETTAETE